MASVVDRVISQNLAKPPPFMKNNVHYEVMMGSEAYGCASGNSDVDIYGFCIPPKEMVFPHLAGNIEGFGRQMQRFCQWECHHVKDPHKDKQYDIAIYNIVRYFSLCMDNNPNMIDSLFVPRRCILHITQLAEMVRENRRMFLHKGVWQKMRGYSYSQMHKMKSLTREGKRKEEVEKHGYDLKFAYHVVRLLGECEQILTEGDLTLDREDRREVMKSIRRGEWTVEQVENFFSEKEKHLEKLYVESSLQYSPDEEKIKNLLLNCLEMHYGSLEKAIVREDKVVDALRRVKEIVNSVEI